MQSFDELNNLSENEIVDIETYFDEMELSNKEREDRKEFAKQVNEVVLFIFALFLTMKNYSYIDKNFIVKQLETRYLDVVKQFMRLDNYINDYIENFSKEIIDTTIKNGADDYWTSKERSTIISVNEANSILGYRQLQEAIEQGYTRKTWITERDYKVRKTHMEVDGKTISLDEYFQVGNSHMLFPHDNVSNLGKFTDAKEICNCRCSIFYN